VTDERFDDLYGGKGIDTPYEREKITYRPQINYTPKELNAILRPETKQAIERSRTFTISQNLAEYDELIQDIEQILKDLAERNPSQLIEELVSLLTAKKYKEVIDFERQHSGYLQSGDYELYSLLFNMKASCQVRRDFIDERFRTQLTSEQDIQKIQEAEEQAIMGWEQLEADVLESYKKLTVDNHEDEDFSIQDSSLTTSTQELTYEILEKAERLKRNKELLHTSLADTSYVHRNRYFMFLEIVEKAKVLVYHSNSLINQGLTEFIMSMQDMTDYAAPKSHLILSFRRVKEMHEALKGRIMTIEDEKESFASEKQYLYQQIETKTVEPIKHWMYLQEDGSSEALDMFSQFMMDSLTTSRKSYDDTLSDVLNFYKSEADFYDQQIQFLKNKEEIRKFCRILEDLGEVTNIQRDWVEDYLKMNGYGV
jgi:hypothetical protein